MYWEFLHFHDKRKYRQNHKIAICSKNSYISIIVCSRHNHHLGGYRGRLRYPNVVIPSKDGREGVPLDVDGDRPQHKRLLGRHSIVS